VTPAALTRLQLGAAAVLLLGSMAVLGHLAFFSSQVAFLPPGNDEGWIGHRFPVTAGVVRTAQPPPPFLFTRRFDLTSLPERARIEVQAIHTLELELNGEPLFDEPRRAWRRPQTLDVAPWLRTGANELRIRVRHPLGPGLLRVEAPAEVPALATDERWTVRPPGGATVRARFVDDTRLHPGSLRAPTPAAIAGERWGWLALLFATATALAFGLESPRLARVRRHIPEATLLAVTGGWALLWATHLADLPLSVGFDAQGHLDYVQLLREQGHLPLAPDGVSMFHPPLFYVLTAGLTGLLDVGPDSRGAGLAYRAVPVAAGLASIWAVWAAARRLFREDPLRTTCAVGIAGMLPMHVYMAAFVSNESTSAATASVLLALAVMGMLSDRLSPALRVALATAGGAALLAKYSGFVVAPLALGAVALRPWIVDRRSFRGTLALGAGLAAGALALGGWFYARSWIRLGTPFPWNREAGGEGLWWHLPGFHTLEFFARFGDSLRHPLFAGFRSYWDGVYSTFWGDGLAAGVASPMANPAGWNLDWMLLGYPLALPVTGLLVLGALRAGCRALQGPDAGRRLAWSLLLGILWAIGLSHLAFAIRYPSYAASKAFYALPALLPLALVGALGLAWVPERLRGAAWRPARAFYFGALTSLGMVLVLAFWG